MSDGIYVELKVKCSDCDKEMRVVTMERTDFSDYLCPKCSAGEFDFDDD